MSKMPSLAPLALLLLGTAGCASTTPGLDQAEPYEPAPKADPPSVGFYLARLDTAIRGWNRAKLTARNEKDAREVRALERAIQREARLRFGDLVNELETGPPSNRTIAAVAMGFSGLEDALSPLLSALEDREPEVVSNALLGLGLLQLPETPLAQICYHMGHNSDAYTRNNAAFAMQRILIAGGSDPCARETARDALLDTESAVRAKAALILYLVDDTESITALGDLLYDDEEVVSAAAATALAGLGATEGFTGQAARLLVAALDRVHPTRRARIQYELARLHGGDLGEDAEPWREWAYRLP